jgi:hypothetical protein
VQLWSTQHPGETGADAVDRRLHAERLQPDGRHQRRHLILARDLPDGAMIIDGGQPWLVHGDQLLRWTPGGYSNRVPRPKIRDVEVLTPPSLLQILASGWSPAVALLHPSARRS